MANSNDSLLRGATDATVFVAKTMAWGLKETFDFRNNWIVPQHDRQHGLDDGRSETFYMMSGVMDSLATGNPLAATGRFFALFPDVLHSVNLVRHSEGKDLMNGGVPIQIDLPSFVADKIDGKTDVQSLSFQFSEGAGSLDKLGELATDRYNRWLLANRMFNFKMFPNGAGRMAEMTTGLGLTIVGGLIANQQGSDTSTFDSVRGYIEMAIGAGSLTAGIVDIFVTEEEQDDGIDLQGRNEFIEVKKSNSETSLPSVLTAIPRYLARSVAKLHNDNKIQEQFAETQESGNEEDIRAFQNDSVKGPLLRAALQRRESSSKLTNTFRSVAGSVIGDFKELGDHFGAVREKMRESDAPMAVLMSDLRSAPARYAGAVQLSTAQLLMPLAVYTAAGGVANTDTPLSKAGFVLAGLSMAASWFFKHRGCAAKTRMSLRGITVGNDNDPDQGSAPQVGQP